MSPRPKPTAEKPAASNAVQARFSRALSELGWTKDDRAALAVSGGGDSLALMLLYADWARANGAPLPVVLIVDHGLRPEAEAEAAQVMQWARNVGLEAHVLRWRGKRPKADIEAAARAARYRLMGGWCRAHACDALFIAHTQEDQAETFLLRVARGSGVDGLSAMRARGDFPLAGFDKPVLYRPLLDVTRVELRKFLATVGQPWLDDPMNEDARFARVRLRAILPVLEASGLSVTRLVQAASHLARAREALEATADTLLTKASYFDEAGYALIDAKALVHAPNEISLRALAHILMTVSGEHYRPRFEKLEQLLAAIARGGLAGGRTLHGARIASAPKAWRRYGAGTLLITREARAAKRAPDVLLAPGMVAVWDGRFRVTLNANAPKSGRLHVAALGDQPQLAEALAHVPAPARGGLPALWWGKTLVAAPHVNMALGEGLLQVHFLGRSHSGEEPQ